MRVESIKPGEATITFSSDDLGFVIGAIAESLEALDEHEFHTRMGETRERAREIRDEFYGIFKRTEAPS